MLQSYPNISALRFVDAASIGAYYTLLVVHNDVIKLKHFPRYWPFVRGIHRSPVNSPHKGQWCGVLIFSLICVWINGWVNNHEAGDLRRYRAHYDDSGMKINIANPCIADAQRVATLVLCCEPTPAMRTSNAMPLSSVRHLRMSWITDICWKIPPKCIDSKNHFYLLSFIISIEDQLIYICCQLPCLSCHRFSLETSEKFMLENIMLHSNSMYWHYFFL